MRIDTYITYKLDIKYNLINLEYCSIRNTIFPCNYQTPLSRLFSYLFATVRDKTNCDVPGLSLYLLRRKTLENMIRKGEHDCDKHFLLLASCFLSPQRSNPSFEHYSVCYRTNIYIFKKCETLSSGKGLREFNTFLFYLHQQISRASSKQLRSIIPQFNCTRIGIIGNVDTYT